MSDFLRKVRIDTFKEEIINLDEAAEHVSKVGKKPRNARIIQRWISKGCGGVRLAAIRIGSEIFTSKEALNAFLNRSTKQPIENQKPADSNEDRLAIADLGI